MLKMCIYLLEFAFIFKGTEPMSTDSFINVTGHLSGKRLYQATLIMQPLSWYETHQECENNDWGLLGFWRPFTHMDSVLDDLLLQIGPYTNATIWENAFRPSEASSWYTWRGVAGACTDRGNLTVDNPADPGLCIALVFDAPSQTPSFRIKNCSETFPSFCTLVLGSSVTVGEYPGYDYTNLPSTIYILNDTNISWDECRTTCQKKDTCVGATYENVTSVCRRLHLIRFTGQFVNYTITWTNDTLTHFVIVAPLGRVVPANSSYTPLPVQNTLPSCFTDGSTATSTSSPTTPWSSTAPTSPTTPLSSTAPTSSTTPLSSTAPTSPTTPLSSTAPTSPTTPLSSTAPTSPTTPLSSTAPTSPTTPLSSTAPTSPTTPLSSTAPTSPTTTTPSPLPPSTSTTPSLTTSTLANPVYQTTSVPLCRKCCHLNGTNKNTVNMTSLSETIDELVRNLTVSKTTTSKYRRQKSSAEDDRPSSVASGVVAVVIISTVFSIILVSDVKYLVEHFKSLKPAGVKTSHCNQSRCISEAE